jgi:hypothetical protein
VCVGVCVCVCVCVCVLCVCVLCVCVCVVLHVVFNDVCIHVFDKATGFYADNIIYNRKGTELCANMSSHSIIRD